MEKRKIGDRKDAKLVRDIPGLQHIMGHLMPNRTDNECYLNYKLDITNLTKYLAELNSQHPDYKTTVFHSIIFALAKMVHERPKMNRFIQGHRMYQRNDISMSFVARRRFTDHSEEALMFFFPKDDDTLDTLSYRIAGEVHEMRKSEVATGGVDEVLDKLSKIPYILLMLFVRIVRLLDFWGKVPKALSDGDPNFSTCLLSNLGSVDCPAVYHHLNNYGTLSFLVTVGVIHQEEMTMEDGHKEMRDVVDVGATIDERIGDGFYFARSIKLLNHLFANPEMLNLPLAQNSGFDYK